MIDVWIVTSTCVPLGLRLHQHYLVAFTLICQLQMALQMCLCGLRCSGFTSRAAFLTTSVFTFEVAIGHTGFG